MKRKNTDETKRVKTSFPHVIDPDVAKRFPIYYSLINSTTESFIWKPMLNFEKGIEIEKITPRKDRLYIKIHPTDSKQILTIDFRHTRSVNSEIGVSMLNYFNNHLYTKKNLREWSITIKLDDLTLNPQCEIVLDILIKFVPIACLGEVGIINPAMTCYMNSILQLLNTLTPFKKCVFDMQDSPIITSLQRLFYDLLTCNSAVSTSRLIKAFGWTKEHINVQHDVQEFIMLFSEILGQSKQNIFEGEILNYIECVNVPFKSHTLEKFFDLQLTVRGNKNIYQSFDQYIEEEILDNNNKYDAGEYGKQKARKGIKFNYLPPVLILQLKRMEYSTNKKSLVKINDMFEFNEQLDLSKYKVNPTKGSDEYSLLAVTVHSGNANSGHYYSYIKKQGKWVLYNDEIVRQADTYEAVNLNFGIPRRLYKLKGSRGDIIEYTTGNDYSAYVLVYIKNKDKDRMLQPFTKEDIPRYLISKFDGQISIENRTLLKSRRGTENFNIFLFTKEMVLGYQGLGINLSLMDLNEEKSFFRNFDCRIVISIPLDFTFYHLKEYLAKQIGSKINKETGKCEDFELFEYLTSNNESYLARNDFSMNYITSSMMSMVLFDYIKASSPRKRYLSFFIYSQEKVLLDQHMPSNFKEEIQFKESGKVVYYSKTINKFFFQSSQSADDLEQVEANQYTMDVDNNLNFNFSTLNNCKEENEPKKDHHELEFEYCHPGTSDIETERKYSIKDLEFVLFIKTYDSEKSKLKVSKIINTNISNYKDTLSQYQSLNYSIEWTCLSLERNTVGCLTIPSLENSKEENSSDAFKLFNLPRSLVLIEDFPKREDYVIELYHTVLIDIYSLNLKRYLSKVKFSTNPPFTEISQIKNYIFTKLVQTNQLGDIFKERNLVFSCSGRILNMEKFIQEELNIDHFHILPDPEPNKQFASGELLFKYVRFFQMRMDVYLSFIPKNLETSFFCMEIEFFDASNNWLISIDFVLPVSIKRFSDILFFIDKYEIFNCSQLRCLGGQKNELYFTLFNSKGNYVYLAIQDPNIEINKLSKLAEGISYKIMPFKGKLDDRCKFNISFSAIGDKIKISPFVFYFENSKTLHELFNALYDYLRDNTMFNSIVHSLNRPVELKDLNFWTFSVKKSNLIKEILLNNKLDTDFIASIFSEEYRVYNILIEVANVIAD